MSRRLVARRSWAATLIAAAAAAAVAAVLALAVAGGSGPTRLDDAVLRQLEGAPQPVAWALLVVVRAASPAAVLASACWLALLCWVLGERRACVLSLTAPASAVLSCALLLQPLVGRADSGRAWLYPSTHAAGAWGWAALVLLLLRPGGALHGRLPRPVAVGMLASAGVLPAAMTAGVVLLGFHHATDALGGAAAALAVTWAAAVAVDAVAGALPRQVCLRSCIRQRADRSTPSHGPTGRDDEARAARPAAGAGGAAPPPAG